jgi:hypothetical protein
MHVTSQNNQVPVFSPRYHASGEGVIERDQPTVVMDGKRQQVRIGHLA